MKEKELSKVVNEWEQDIKDNPFISTEAKKKILEFRAGIKESCKSTIEEIKNLKTSES